MNNFKNKRVVVTGANGFVGAHLVAALEKESAEVFAFVRERSDLARLLKLNTSAKRVSVDLLDYETVKTELASIKPHYVFHTAVSRDYEQWQQTLDMNGSATLHLLNASLSPTLEKFVHCGSSLEYGDIQAPYKESDAIRPSSLFGASKAAGALQLQQLAITKALPVVILRLFHVYGVLDNEHRLVATVIKNLISNTPITLTKPGFRHDFIYVSDVVNACLMAALKDNISGQIFNIGSGQPVTNEEVVAMISDMMGKHPELKIGEFSAREWDKADWYADTNKSHNKLGWQPQTSLTTGLQKCVTAYLESES